MQAIPIPFPAAPSARDRILRTAHDLFYQNGVRATGIDRIIKEAGVTKVTFYRHFPSKDDLIKAFLDYRHDLWMTWFVDAMERYKGNKPCVADALVFALGEWFASVSYRGCAFINTVVELDGDLPEVSDMCRRHKLDVVRAIANLLPESETRVEKAEAAAMAVDGAIFLAQMDKSSESALKGLRLILKAIL